MRGQLDAVLAAFDDTTDGSGTVLERLSYYDLVLAVIPATFLAAALVGEALSLPPRAVVTGASVVGGLAVLDALFVNPPRTDG